MARLSVNLNKVALLRNSRRTGVPNPHRFALIPPQGGAHGLTQTFAPVTINPPN